MESIIILFGISIILVTLLIAIMTSGTRNKGRNRNTNTNKVKITYDELKKYNHYTDENLEREYLSEYIVNDQQVFEIEKEFINEWNEKLIKGEDRFTIERRKLDIGENFANNGEIEKAAEHYLKLINENVNNYGAYLGLWRMYKKNYMIDDEIFVLNAMLEQFPDVGDHMTTTWNYRLKELLFKKQSN